jgi:hypothetical protein
MTDFEHPENFNDHLVDDDRWFLAEWSAVIEALHRHQAELKRLADEDPMGYVLFGENDEWIEKRLSRTPPK